MHHYIDKEDMKHAFVLDDDSDLVDSFNIAVEFIRKNYDVTELEYWRPTWNTGMFKLLWGDLQIELRYVDFGGTDLRVDENVSKQELEKVERLAQEIYHEIHRT